MYVHIGMVAVGGFVTVNSILLYFFGSSSGFFAAIDLTGLVLFLIVGLGLLGSGAASLLLAPNRA